MKNIQDFQRMKRSDQKIVVSTCYSNWSAQILDKTEIDCLLVGDTVAMVEYGYDSTLKATVDMMEMHVEAVSRGAPSKFIIGDMPFLSYRKGLTATMNAVERLMRAGANAVKLEGAAGNLELVKHIVESGVPVMGHLGLTPQMVNQLGGYKVQGRGDDAVQLLLQQAKALEAAGCFSLVLECVPELVAEQVTHALQIPTIGIGAGPKTSGQVLVFHDMLGMNDFNSKFIKRYLNGQDLMIQAFNQYKQEVQTNAFPQPEHCYA
ncbi:MAG: 3-methyl-2-oxobutanoate hydroxymethyltransferase [Coxiellaceae bacterium]|nr:3-methyl-2-oxobutanoate hydroxymethyltransferase [Coxiellaceae bacterium]